MGSSRTFTWVFGLGLLLTMLVTYAGIFHAPCFTCPSQQELDQVYFLTEGSVQFTHSSTTASELSRAVPAKPITLPHMWEPNQPSQPTGYAWYTLPFELSTDRPLPDAVFIPRGTMNVEVFINGHRIGGLGAMEGELSRNWNRPYYFEFSNALLKPEHNVLQVRLAGYANYRSGLGRVWLGHHRILEPNYESAFNWHITGSLVAAMVAVVTGLLLLVSSILLPQRRRGLMLLGLAVMVWWLRNLGFYVDWAPLAHEHWAKMVQAMHAWFACLLGQFLLDYMGRYGRTLSKWLWGYAALVSFAVVLVDPNAIPQFTASLLAPVLPLVTWLVVDLLIHSVRQRNSEAAILGFSAMLFVTLSLRDMSALIAWIDFESVLLAQYTGAVLFLACSTLMLVQYRQALMQLSQSNTVLNTALAQREAQLVQQFNLLRQAERLRTQDAERRRIMQDIHDGVGSSLVAALNIAEMRNLDQTEMRQVLQDCLDDLRFAIDSLDPESDDLLALLGNFRWRYDRRLRQAGIQLEWQVSDNVPKLEGYSSREVFDLLRIVQEAFANVLKHAKANVIALQVHWLPDTQHIELRITDNGCGFDSQSAQAGRGLKHMRSRAKSIPAELGFRQGPAPWGTTVYLRLNRARPALQS